MEYKNITDEERSKLLKNEQDDMERCQIIRSFSNDELMMQYVFTIKDEQIRAGVTYSLAKIENKIKVIESLTDEKVITSATIELPSSEYKIILLSKVKSGYYKNIIIRSIRESDAEILKVLHSIEDEKDKASLITRLTDDKLKLKFLKEIKDDINKSKIIMTIDNDDIKVEYINKLEDRAAKKLLISSLQSNQLRQIYLESYNKKYLHINIPEGMTIGMEIECEGEKSVDAYIISDILDGWDSKIDTSLEEGIEITSPKLTNSKDDTDNLFLVCNILQELEENTSERCGAHIHIGADFLKTKEAYTNLIELWSNNEEMFYVLSNIKGEVPREGTIDYALPISKRVLKDIKAGEFDDYESLDKKQFIERIKKVQRAEKGEGIVRTGLNFLTTDAEERGINTIEFRVSNGTIDANTWIENATLFGGLVAISQRISEIQAKNIEELSEEEKSVLDKFSMLKGKYITNEERLSILLDLCVPEDMKQVFIERYNENSKLMEQNNKIKYKLNEFISGEPVIFPIGTNLGTTLKNIAFAERATSVRNCVVELRKGVQELETPNRVDGSDISLED